VPTTGAHNLDMVHESGSAVLFDLVVPLKFYLCTTAKRHRKSGKQRIRYLLYIPGPSPFSHFNKSEAVGSLKGME